MGLIKGILIYKYAKRRATKKRDRQEAHDKETIEQELHTSGWLDEICDHCGRTNEEHLNDVEPCS